MSCKDQGKGPKKTAYENSVDAKQEILNPNLATQITTGVMGNIQFPEVYSPAILRNRGLTALSILKTLVTAEKVARRQYDETMLFSRFPELRQFEPELLYIRNDEYEHGLILNCMIEKLSNSTVQATTAKPVSQPLQTDIILTPKSVGELYVTMLDRFAEIEQKSINSYQEFLTQVQQSKAAIEDIPDDATYNKVVVPINTLEQKINKHLNEERNHLDVVIALKEMFNSMKLGNVY